MDFDANYCGGCASIELTPTRDNLFFSIKRKILGITGLWYDSGNGVLV